MTDNREEKVAIATIGVGQIGCALVRHLARGGERIVLAPRDESDAA